MAFLHLVSTRSNIKKSPHRSVKYLFNLSRRTFRLFKNSRRCLSTIRHWIKQTLCKWVTAWKQQLWCTHIWKGRWEKHLKKDSLLEINKTKKHTSTTTVLTIHSKNSRQRETFSSEIIFVTKEGLKVQGIIKIRT